MQILDVAFDAGEPMAGLPIVARLHAAAEAEGVAGLVTGAVEDRGRRRSDRAVGGGRCRGIESTPKVDYPGETRSGRSRSTYERREVIAADLPPQSGEPVWPVSSRPAHRRSTPQQSPLTQ